MKKVSIGIVFIIVCISLYILLGGDKKSESTVKIVHKNIPEKEQKVQVTDLAKESTAKVKKIDSGSKVADNEVITDSKVLKDLYLHLKKRNWDAFDEVYDTQIKMLREDGDHTLFYQQFKDFFIENNLSTTMQRGILAFLADASTKESIALIFEMFDESIISDKEVEFNFVTYLANSISISKEDPSINFQGVVESLQHGYQTTENDYLRRGAAVLLAKYETPETEVMLFRDYMEADTPEKKRAGGGGV